MQTSQDWQAHKARTRESYEQDLLRQIELKRIREAEERRREVEEDLKLERRIKEQREKMQREFEQEVAKREARDVAVRHRSWRDPPVAPAAPGTGWLGSVVPF